MSSKILPFEKVKMNEDVVFTPQSGKQSDFLLSEADIVIYGGAAGGGKTYGLLLEAARHTGNKNFGAVFFRKNSTQITNEGGLWDTSLDVYPYLGAEPRSTRNDYKFPSGAKVSFRHLEYESTVLDWQGSQIPLLCCQENTPIIMADGLRKSLSDIKIGDYVKTLQGKAKISKIGKRQLKDCISVTMQDGTKQIQSTNHEFLTPFGWVSYDTLYESHLSLTFSPKQHHVSHRSDQLNEQKHRFPLQSHVNHKNHRSPFQEHVESKSYRQSEKVTFVDKAYINQESDSLKFDYDNQEDEQPVLFHQFPVVRHLPIDWSKEKDYFLQLDQSHDVFSCVQSESKLKDYLYDYFSCHGLYDEPLYQPQDNNLNDVPSPICAEVQNQKDLLYDDRDTIQNNIHHKVRYNHPYNDSEHTSEDYVLIDSCDIIPVGKKWVIDLTIEVDNHYITESGLVNKNCFDELTHFSEYQFFYMLSRNRSTCGIRPYIRATTNPDADSWVAKFIQWWWDPETGDPIEERSGVIRWMIRIKDEIKWFNTYDEAKAEASLVSHDIEPKSVTFIPSKLDDNQILVKADPGYRANLYALSEVEQKRLLGGNWLIRATGGKKFKKVWFKIHDEYPRKFKKICRYWDLAATEPKPGKDPDWTVGTKMGIDEDDIIWKIDQKRLRGTPGTVDKLITDTAEEDGRRVTVVIEEEGGSSGKFTSAHFAKLLIGYIFRSDRPSGSKEVRANPYAAYAENGNVNMVRGDWNKVDLDEHEAFPNPDVHDDTVDSCSGGFKFLTEKPLSTAEAMKRSKRAGRLRRSTRF